MSNELILRPQSFDDLLRFSDMAAQSGFVPTAYKGKPCDIMLAVQMGSELGLAPMQALQNIACINGRPSVWGDALLGLCKQSPQFEDIIETIKDAGTEKAVATCVVKRKGKTPVEASFSVADAKKAHLWMKEKTPWVGYPDRMLKMRARGFALRDQFPDVLRGLISAEEAGDIPPDKKLSGFEGTTIESKAEPPLSFIDQAELDLREPNGTLWLKAFDRICHQCETMTDFADIRALDTVQNALKKAPTAIRGIVEDTIKKTVMRLSPRPDPEDDPPLEDGMADRLLQVPVLPDSDDDTEMVEYVTAMMDFVQSKDEIVAWYKGLAGQRIKGIRKTDPMLFAELDGIIDNRTIELDPT